MRVLLDSHTLLWAVDQQGLLGAGAVTALQDPANDLLLSAATVWEIAIKVGLKKLVLSYPYREWMTRAIGDLGVSVLPITVEYAEMLVGLAAHHRDPFDRLIVAQAMVENIPVITADAEFDKYGVTRIWD